MMDLSKTIQAKSDQLNADDLISGPITIKINKVSLRGGDQPVAINYDGDDGRAFLPCKTVRRILIHAWGNNGNGYVGKRMTLYRDPEVIYGGVKTGGIRVSHMSGLSDALSVSLLERRGKKSTIKILPLPEDRSDVLFLEGKTVADSGIQDLERWFNKLSPTDKACIKPRLQELKDFCTTQQPTNNEDELEIFNG